MKEKDSACMLIFMIALQKYAVKYGEMVVFQDEVEGFMEDDNNFMAVKPMKNGIMVYHGNTRKRKRPEAAAGKQRKKTKELDL
jgi:hypothetical protein